MRRRRPRGGGRRGAETLEFSAALGLVLLVVVVVLRALAVVQLQLRAEDDARALARAAAVCEREGTPSLSDVDGQAPAAGPPVTTRTPDGLVAVTVTFRSQEIVPRLPATAVTPRATVTMRREPGCP